MQLSKKTKKPLGSSYKIESVKQSIEKVLRATTINSFEDLIERAVQAEIDDAKENPRKTPRN